MTILDKTNYDTKKLAKVGKQIVLILSNMNIDKLCFALVFSSTNICLTFFVWGSLVVVVESNKLEQIQKIWLKVKLGDMYISYAAALEMCGLKPLSERQMKDAWTLHENVWSILGIKDYFLRMLLKKIKKNNIHLETRRCFKSTLPLERLIKSQLYPFPKDCLMNGQTPNNV